MGVWGFGVWGGEGVLLTPEEAPKKGRAPRASPAMPGRRGEVALVAELAGAGARARTAKLTCAGVSSPSGSAAYCRGGRRQRAVCRGANEPKHYALSPTPCTLHPTP